MTTVARDSERRLADLGLEAGRPVESTVRIPFACAVQHPEQGRCRCTGIRSVPLQCFPLKRGHVLRLVMGLS